MNRTFLAAAVAAGVLANIAPVAGQSGAATAPPPASVAASVTIDERSARDTHERLQELLRDYPPSLTRVLQLDPALLDNDTYLAPYPALATFVRQHPDIVHHPAFYLGEPDSDDRED